MPIQFLILMGLFIGFIVLWSKIENSEKYLRLMVRIRLKNAEAHALLANYLYDRKHYEEAKKEVQLAIALRPRYRFAHYLLLHIMADDGTNIDKRIEQNRYVLELFPDDPIANEILGVTYKCNQQEHESEECFRRVIELAPRYYRGYWQLADLFYLQKRYQEAEVLGKQALRQFYLDASLHYRMGSIYYGEGCLSDAVKELIISIRLGLKEALVYGILGDIYWEMGRYKKAEKAYRVSLAKDSTNFLINLNLGRLLRLRNRTEDALGYLKTTYELEPMSENTIEAYAKVLRDLDRNEECLTLIEKWLEVTPDGFFPLMTKASIKKSLGDFTEVKELAEESRRNVPEDENQQYNLACIESILGNCDHALEYLKNAVQEKDWDREWAWEDPDLQWIRDDPRFVEIVGERAKE